MIDYENLVNDRLKAGVTYCVMITPPELLILIRSLNPPMDATEYEPSDEHLALHNKLIYQLTGVKDMLQISKPKEEIEE